ncbi:hypothetical protein FCM35_KLT05403 [Carex littledalei]|uniref:Uncharacterized protein n=1 Tax=Carex littledalei TaxID=544730 RepID=A0A833V9Q1_9POAL|nr:hypothetical protein FCM35_KLT05403 [Carex littledalei]
MDHGTFERDLDKNCQKKPDFIEDVLFQKDLYASYNMIQANPAYEPTYTFMEPDSPKTECNPMSLFNEIDKKQTLLTGQDGMNFEANCSYGADKGSILLTVDPTFDTVLKGHDYEEDPPTKVWQEDMNVDSMPKFSGADMAIFGLCMDQDSEGVDLAAINASQLTMNKTPMQRTIEVLDYEVDPLIQVEPENTNIDLAGQKLITELVDGGIDQNNGSVDLDISDPLQLSMDAIPMETILEDTDHEEVPFIPVEHDNMHIDLLSHILSDIDNGIVSERIDRDIDLIGGGIDVDTPNLNAITDKANREADLLERNLDHSPVVPVCNSPGRPSLEGQSRSQFPIKSRDRRRRSRSRAHCMYRSPSKYSSKLLLQSRSPVKSKDHYQRSPSRPVTNSRDSHRRSRSPNSRGSHRSRSRSRSRSGIYSRDHHIRSYSRPWVNLRDNSKRSRSRLKSTECDRRTWSRSRSPINLRDLRGRSHSQSQSSINSGGFHRSRSRSPISHRNLGRQSPRRNRPSKRSPQMPKHQQSLHPRSSRRSPIPLISE